MTPLKTLPIEPTGDRFPNQSWRGFSRKPTDSKIHDLIMPRISLPLLREGSLLASATAPQVVIPVSNSMKGEEKYLHLYRHRRETLILRRSTLPSNYFPIGLDQCEPHNWINAWMQFLLFIPLLREIFSFTPPSLRPFNEFIDQYFIDLQENRLISCAKSCELVRCLFGKFPQFFQTIGWVDLHEMTQAISQCACAFTLFDHAGFRSDWQILWDASTELSLQKVFEMDVVPPELLISLRFRTNPAIPPFLISNVLRKQYFSSKAAVCFDLDAFIEHRMEVGGSYSYYTYLKVDGTWVQCVDERIVPLRRSTLLDLPLQRGILFHYRRVWIGQNCPPYCSTNS